MRRTVGGPRTMTSQLQKLIELNNPPQLTIQVVPFGQGWHAGLDGAFSIFRYPDPMDLDVVSLAYRDGPVAGLGSVVPAVHGPDRARHAGSEQDLEVDTRWCGTTSPRTAGGSPPTVLTMGATALSDR
nr:Scr1 family TA system antitoxin-like transcriptional regulator [Streptomyces sp. SID4919]